MYKYFLFSDSNVWHYEVPAKTWREALAFARANFDIRGSVRINAENYDSRDYKKAGGYTFTLTGVMQ